MRLEHKIPPPLVLLIVAVAMGSAQGLAGLGGPDAAARLTLGLLLMLAGIASAGAGIVAFSRAGTTIDPVQITRAATLVTSGIFRRTRNPMYVGMLLLLSGWALCLGGPGVWAGPAAFYLFITRFQILPEERAMTAKFDQAYRDYQARTPRWLW